MNKLYYVVFILLFFVLNIYSERPTNYAISNHWLRVALEETDVESKIRFLRRSILLNNDNYKAVQELGLLYMKTGETDLGNKFLNDASQIYNRLKQRDEVVTPIVTKKSFVKKNLGNIQYITLSEAREIDDSEIIKTLKKSDKLVKIKDVSTVKDVINLNLFTTNLTNNVYSDRNQSDYFLVLSNLSYNSLNIVAIHTINDKNINVNSFAVKNILTSDFKETLHTDVENITLAPYETIVVKIETKALNKGLQRVIIQVDYTVVNQKDLLSSIISKEISIK